MAAAQAVGDKRRLAEAIADPPQEPFATEGELPAISGVTSETRTTEDGAEEQAAKRLKLSPSPPSSPGEQPQPPSASTTASEAPKEPEPDAGGHPAVPQATPLAPWEWAVAQHPGKKAYQQDRYTCLVDLAAACRFEDLEDPMACGNWERAEKHLAHLRRLGKSEGVGGPVAFFGVYDGHGDDFCSEWLQRRFAGFLARALDKELSGAKRGAQNGQDGKDDQDDQSGQPESSASSPSSSSSSSSTPISSGSAAYIGSAEFHTVVKAAILRACREADDALLQALRARVRPEADQDRLSGSCLAGLLRIGDYAWVLNVGDSGVVLAREVPEEGEGGLSSVCCVRLTSEHNTALSKERSRIRKAGGTVDAEGRVGGRLGVTRAFGDLPLKGRGVVSTPEIRRFALSPQDRFFVLACDGLFSVINHDDVVRSADESMRAAIPRILKASLQAASGLAFFSGLHTPLPSYLAPLAPLTPLTPLASSAGAKDAEGCSVLAQTVCNHLVRQAVVERAGKDNVTVVIVMPQGLM